MGDGRFHDFTLDEALAIAQRNDPGENVPSVSRTLIAHIADLERQLAELRSARDAAVDLEHDDKRDDPEFWWTVAAFRAVELTRQIERAEAAESQLAEVQSALSHRWECQQSLERTVQTLRDQLAAQRERDGRDAERLDWLDANALYLVIRAATPRTDPSVIKPNREAIDAALKDRPCPP